MRGDRSELHRVGLGSQDDERRHDEHEPGLGQGKEPERPACHLTAPRVAQDQQVAQQRNRFPGHQERDHVPGGQHGERREQRQVEDGEVQRGARTRPVIPGRVEGDADRDEPEQCREHPGQAARLQLQRADDDRAAQRDDPGIAPDQRGHPADHGCGSGQGRDGAARAAPRPAATGEKRQGRGQRPPRRCHIAPVQSVHRATSSAGLSAMKVKAAVLAASRFTATSRPCSRASGLGGQPGIQTSTGRIASTEPCVKASAG